MSTMASQITSLMIVYSTVYSGADQRNHQSSASMAFCAGNSPVSGEFPAQRASNPENVSIWWRHHAGLPPHLCAHNISCSRATVQIISPVCTRTLGQAWRRIDPNPCVLMNTFLERSVYATEDRYNLTLTRHLWRCRLIKNKAHSRLTITEETIKEISLRWRHNGHDGVSNH